MTKTDSRIDPDRVLATDADLFELLEVLLQRANERHLWLVLLDAGHRVTGPLMPLADLPSLPDTPERAHDVGVASAGELLAARLAMVVHAVEAHELALVWERRGSAEFRDDERAWAGALAEHCAALGVRLRAQFVLHDAGLRVLAPADQL